MKVQFNHFPLALALLLLTTTTTALPENAVAHGHLKKFSLDNDGSLGMQLFDNGPSLACNMKSINSNSNANPRTCMDGDTVVTIVDSDCGDNLPWGQQKKCHAVSIVDGDSGDTYYIDTDGEVVQRNQADYPKEEDPPNENEPTDEYSDRRSLLRGNSNSLGITFDVEGRDLQATTPVIDILVVYTQFAKEANGGTTSAMQNRVNLAIAESNQAYANSGIDLVLNLVHLEEDTTGYDIDRTDQSSMSPSLTALRSSTDGNLDYVHQLRTDVGADMVALITAGAGCGIANLCGNSPTAMPSANCVFSVTRWDCATGYYSFSHELGHNMGVTHDKGTTRTCGSTDYRHGYRSLDAAYRSILAYSCATSQCDNMPKDGCTRRQFFSTPDPNYLYNGSPQGWGTNDAADTAGVGETNNAKKINDVAAHIAAFYDANTQAPTTASPTNPPTLPQPSSSPTTATPTSSPTTKAPIVCSLANVGESCRDGGDCCSGSCSGGKPSRRTCLSTAPAPSPSEGTTPTATAPSTPTPPSFSCGGNKSTCSSNFDCCSLNCKSGQCKGGR